MSLDIYLEDPGKYGSYQIFDANITHNLGPMAAAAGLYKAMWRPDEEGWAHARDITETLRAGIETLEAHPATFKELEPDNGWGSYEWLLKCAWSYLRACVKYPDALVRVSR